MGRWGVMLFFWLACSLTLYAEPVAFTVARVFTDHAVLQRDQMVPVWGTAAPGTTVSLTLGDQRLSTQTGSGGRWLLSLASGAADSEGRDLVIETSDGQGRTLEDVVVGDVWFCAGQSNMELGMAAIANRAQEMKDLKYPGLRLYLVSKSASGAERPEVFGAWVPSDRPSVTAGGWNGFSAVAYTFGRRLQKELGVPVGIIQAAYGGSPIAAWLPPADLAADPEYGRYAAQIRRTDRAWAEALAADPQARHPFDDPADTRDLGPGSIWNAMVAPLGPLAVKGVAWYQGETDVGDGTFYTKKMGSLITAFRTAFRQPGLPFYFVQLAPWNGYGDSLPPMWSAQEAVLGVPGTGMALTVDVGDSTNIHPADKRPVGERLALQALVKTYGRADLRADGPVATGWTSRGERVVVAWAASGGLTTRDGGRPLGFEVRDDGGTWRSVEAELGEGGVVLSASGVTGVRYAWSSTPAVNLTDAGGLPARPFSKER